MSLDGRRAESVDHLVGMHVADWRKGAGLTQDDLASAMNALLEARGAETAEWVRQTVDQIERGKRRVGWDELLLLAAYFNTSPLSFIVGPDYDSVRISGIDVSGREWRDWWTTPASEGIKKRVRSLIVFLAGHTRRPWARSGVEPPEAYRGAREEHLQARPRLPGPTFVADGGLRVMTHVPPFGNPVRFRLEPGVPYVARDEYEQKVLEDQERAGKVRRIDRHEAFRLRGRTAPKRPKGEGTR